MRVVLAYARSIAESVAAALGPRVEIAGAVRRGEEVIDEVVLVVDRAPSEVERALAAVSEEVVRVQHGLRAYVPLESGPFPVRVRCATRRGFTEALLRETGSDAHVDALFQRAAERNLALANLDEAEVYAALELPFVPPELRDDDSFEVPSDLVRGVRGILHVHTDWSDGTASLADMARAAAKHGHSYVGISDHSRAASYANGLDPERIGRQRDEIARARREVPEITILHGIEVDILPDGTLDLPDPVLGRLDFVIASVHSHLGLDLEAQTRRIVRAVTHPLVDVLGHPTGRLIGGREPIAFDHDAVFDAAARAGTCLEINTTAQRLDLSAALVRRAATFGARFVIDPDAHETRSYDTIRDGLSIAKQARLAASSVMNTLDCEGFRAALAARRKLAA
ncbi:MAG: DNA polymerase/3'-5' exonuclease PolX [Polyangiales bacterium]